MKPLNLSLLIVCAFLLLSCGTLDSQKGQWISFDPTGANARDEFGDIELRLEFKTESPDRSGVYLRGEGEVSTFGKARVGGSWNKLRVIQIGNLRWVWVNGEQVAEGIRENRILPARGLIKLSSERGALGWRKVKVRPIEAEEANALLRGDDRTLGFEPLLKGGDLAGWQGHLEGKTVSNGILRWVSGGHLYTKKKYSNFVFRFEFLLSSGANNGIAVRYPGKGDPAYTAMTELQILDDSAEKYAELDPRQYNGSAYGMTAALRGYQRDLGEWNYEEVTVSGSTIRVELNGTVILDTDLSKVTDYLDGKEHPGKLIPDGFLGFAGHGKHDIKFRGISLRELD